MVEKRIIYWCAVACGCVLAIGILSSWLTSDMEDFTLPVPSPTPILESQSPAPTNQPSALPPNWDFYYSLLAKGDWSQIKNYMLTCQMGLSTRDPQYARTPLHWAGYYANGEMAEFLIKTFMSQKPREKELVAFVEAEDKEGKTPLVLAHKKRSEIGHFGEDWDMYTSVIGILRKATQPIRDREYEQKWEEGERRKQEMEAHRYEVAVETDEQLQPQQQFDINYVKSQIEAHLSKLLGPDSTFYFPSPNGNTISYREWMDTHTDWSYAVVEFSFTVSQSQDGYKCIAWRGVWNRPSPYHPVSESSMKSYIDSEIEMVKALIDTL